MQANSDMQQAQSQKPLLGADNNTLVALLAINLVVYVMLGLIKTIYYLESLLQILPKNIECQQLD